MKKLLIIIPFYNVEKYLEEAIEGVLQQTYQNFHLVSVVYRHNKTINE
jgi:glycosyltransferase involved in cell wall biosynthesis